MHKSTRILELEFIELTRQGHVKQVNWNPIHPVDVENQISQFD